MKYAPIVFGTMVVFDSCDCGDPDCDTCTDPFPRMKVQGIDKRDHTALCVWIDEEGDDRAEWFSISSLRSVDLLESDDDDAEYA